MLNRIVDTNSDVAIEFDAAMVVIHLGEPSPKRMDILNALAVENDLEFEMYICDTGQWMIEIDGITVPYIEEKNAPGVFRFQRRLRQHCLTQ